VVAGRSETIPEFNVPLLLAVQCAPARWTRRSLPRRYLTGRSLSQEPGGRRFPKAPKQGVGDSEPMLSRNRVASRTSFYFRGNPRIFKRANSAEPRYGKRESRSSCAGRAPGDMKRAALDGGQ